ncbi:hypothetical protein V7O66_02115 [Methanolobus sp. ZRKC3]
MFTKCAGVSGRCQAGICHYCSHPENRNPVPIIPNGAIMLDTCPVSQGTE